MTLAFPPNDPLFNEQWYLLNNGQTGGTPFIDLNVVSVWQDYTGAGVRVAVIDDGVAYDNPDLAANYDIFSDLDAVTGVGDASPLWATDNRGTAVAGIIAADGNNAQGGVGVAPDATLTGIYINASDPNFLSSTTVAFQQMVNFDVVNTSWFSTPRFSIDFNLLPGYANAVETAAVSGRNGLGTALVFAAGNDRQIGGSANEDNLRNSRYTITVGAVNHDGIQTFYSNSGANLLVSAFGGEAGIGEMDGIVTTDRPGTPGYDSDRPGNYTNQSGNGAFGGTEAAAAMVSGVIALMLEANPNLGYRDIQEILAYSARQTDFLNPTWQTNGASNWNGGGLHTSSSYGFGVVDAHAAVRLAETWQSQQTASNAWWMSASTTPNAAILDNLITTSQVTFSNSLTIDQVELSVNIDHSWIGDLELILVSPSGTQSVLLARPGQTADAPAGSDADDVRFTFASTQFWGEDAAGTWTLLVRDRATGDQGVLENWSLRINGDLPDNNNTYIYTDEFGALGWQSERSFLQDLSGSDTLNAAAVTSSLTLNLDPGATSLIAGRTLTISSGTVIETAIGGDGDDIINGNAFNNNLYGRRGNDALQGYEGSDFLSGFQGDDWLNGGSGNDTLVGGTGRDTFYFGDGNPGIDTISDFEINSDRIHLDGDTFSALLGNVAPDFARVATDADALFSSAIIVYSQSTGNLFYNPDSSFFGFGNGGQFATVAGAPALTASDFTIV